MLWAFAAPALQLMKKFSCLCFLKLQRVELSRPPYDVKYWTTTVVLWCVLALCCVEWRVILGLIMSGHTNSFQIQWNGCSLQGTRCTTYPTLSPFLFDLLHLSSAVPRSLLDLPPHRPGPPWIERETQKRWRRYSGLGRLCQERCHKPEVNKHRPQAEQEGLLSRARHLLIKHRHWNTKTNGSVRGFQRTFQAALIKLCFNRLL